MALDIAAYIVAECRDDEACVAVVGSTRLSTEEFVAILAQNGVLARPLGKGTGRGVDVNGGPWRAAGVLVLAVPESDVKRFAMYAQLHGLVSARFVSI